MNGENDLYSNKKLDQINEKLNTIFNINVNHIIQNNDDKVTGIKFTLPQGNENSNDIIFELLDFYIIPAFILNNTNTTSIINIKINNKASNRIITIKKYIKDNNTYIDSKQAKQQKEKAGRLQKIKSSFQSEEKIEFIEINKDKFDFNFDTSEKVEITFASSEINTEHIEGVLKCVSNFKKLIENELGKSIIEVNHHQLTTESKGKLNIYPFFAKKIKGNKSEIVFCLASEENNAECIKSIFGGGQDQCKIKHKQNEYLLFNYNLNSAFLGNSIQSFNDQSKIIEEQFSEKIKIKDSQEKEEESKRSEEIEIKIENVTCSTSSLRYENGHLQLKKSTSEEKEKLKFSFDIGISDHNFNQIEKAALDNVYNAIIYKIVSLISFFDLCLDESKFSVFVDDDKHSVTEVNLAIPGVNLVVSKAKNAAAKISDLFKIKYYTEQVVSNIMNRLQSLNLFYTKKVSFRLEVECQKIKLNNLNNIESLVSGISILNAQSKAFSDTINNPLVRRYLSNFLYKNDNQVSCTYVITYPKNFKIESLFDKFQESFKSISNSFEKTSGDGHLLYSMTIDIDKLLSNPINEPKAVQNIEVATEVTKELKITEEGTNAKPQSQIEYNINWEKECFCKIGDANDYDELEQNLKEASKFVHERLVYVCEQLLKKIDTLQKGREQSPSQQFLTMDKSTAEQYRTTLNKNIESYNSFIRKKKDEFNTIKLNLNETQESNIDKLFDKLDSAVCNYKEMARVNLFISKNGTRLSEVLEKNIEKLEQLIEKIIPSKELVEEVIKNTIPQAGTDNFTTDEIAENKLLDNTQDSDSVENNSPELDVNETGQEKEVESFNNDTNAAENTQQEPQANDNEEQESKTTSDDIYQLFQKLSSNLDKWENLGQSSQNDQDQTITNLFQNLTSKIENCITQRKKNSDEKIVERYKQMQNHVEIIYYSDLTRAETAIHNTVGLALYEKELKTKEKESNEISVQKTNRAKIGSEFVVGIVQGGLSLYNKCKDAITPAKKKTAEPKDEVYEPANNTNYEYGCRTQNSNTCRSNYDQLNFHSSNNPSPLHSQSFPSPKLSNLKKCKRTLKAMFSEKENYAFLAFCILGVTSLLAYFIPGGLRDLVPHEKQKGIDITIAVSASIVIILCFAALIYSAYDTIKISNLEFGKSTCAAKCCY